MIYVINKMIICGQKINIWPDYYYDKVFKKQTKSESNKMIWKKKTKNKIKSR